MFPGLLLYLTMCFKNSIKYCFPLISFGMFAAVLRKHLVMSHVSPILVAVFHFI